MLTGTVLLVIALLFFVFFVIYKKDMLMKMFSLNITGPANDLRGQLEVTADSVVKRMEEQMTQLELLLQEADTKAVTLDKHIQLAEKMTEQQQNHYQQLAAFQRQLADFQNEMLITLRQQREEVKVLAISLATVSSPVTPSEPPPKPPQESEASGPPDHDKEDFGELVETIDSIPVTLAEEIGGDRRGLVLAMAEQGYDVTEIAKSTGVSQGEIQLLLQLHIHKK